MFFHTSALSLCIINIYSCINQEEEFSLYLLLTTLDVPFVILTQFGLYSQT